MATSRSTTLAWYTAGSVVAAGVAGTDWWPGGAITTDTVTTGTVSGSTVTGTGYSTSWVGRFVKVGTLETYITAATTTTLTVVGTPPIGSQSVTVWGEWWQNQRLCGDIPQSNMWSKTPLYTNIYLKNVHATYTYNNISVGVTRSPGNQNSSVTIGKSVSAGLGVNEAARTNANLGTAPASVVFGNTLTIASLAPGQFQSIWIKHTPLYSSLSASSTTEAGVALTISANYT